jgi:hypothetical protein
VPLAIVARAADAQTILSLVIVGVPCSPKILRFQAPPTLLAIGHSPKSTEPRLMPVDSERQSFSSSSPRMRGYLTAIIRD